MLTTTEIEYAPRERKRDESGHGRSWASFAIPIFQNDQAGIMKTCRTQRDDVPPFGQTNGI